MNQPLSYPNQTENLEDDTYRLIVEVLLGQ